MLRIGIRSASLTPRSAVFGSWTVAAAFLLALGLGLCGSHADAKPAVVRLDPPSMPSSPLLSPKFEAPVPLSRLIAPKGSVALDGTSLTVNGVEGAQFDCVLIPHTLQATTWNERRTGDRVNLEVDLIARYVARLAETA